MNQIAMAAPAANGQVVRLESCERCKFSAVAGRTMECHRNPPQASIIPGPGGQPVTMACFPPVNPAGFCGEWRPKIEMAAA